MFWRLVSLPAAKITPTKGSDYQLKGMTAKPWKTK
jgi:hypothetical protein